jgi:hypothetical protein
MAAAFTNPWAEPSSTQDRLQPGTLHFTIETFAFLIFLISGSKGTTLFFCRS